MAADKRSDDRDSRPSDKSMRIARITLQAVCKIPKYLVSSRDIV
jgi:hypothetical protein